MVTSQSVVDSWVMCSDKNINSDDIFSFDAVCVGSPVIKKVNNYNEF